MYNRGLEPCVRGLRKRGANPHMRYASRRQDSSRHEQNQKK